MPFLVKEINNNKSSNSYYDQYLYTAFQSEVQKVAYKEKSNN